MRYYSGGYGRRFFAIPSALGWTWLNAIRQILKSNFPRFKRSSAMLKIILKIEVDRKQYVTRTQLVVYLEVIPTWYFAIRLRYG